MSETVSTAILSGMNVALFVDAGHEVLLSSRPERSGEPGPISPELCESVEAEDIWIPDSRIRGFRDDTVRSCALAAKVLQAPTVPDFSPVWNQRWRCSEEPWVNESGTT